MCNDISAELIAENYDNVKVCNYFYVWLDTRNGAKKLYFATSSTIAKPTNRNQLVFLLEWYNNNFNNGQFIIRVGGRLFSF
jgi:hypothetical protein